MAQQNSEETKCKKLPQEFGTPVTLLKDGDFQWRRGLPCHPTTIDMHRIRKTQRGKVSFTSGMSQEMVKSRLQERFPYLKGKRFFCAAVKNETNDSKRFQLHGPKPSLWDGETIKKNILGNSSLYVLEYKMFQDSQSFQESESTMEVDENQLLQEGLQTGCVPLGSQNSIASMSMESLHLVLSHVDDGNDPVSNQVEMLPEFLSVFTKQLDESQQGLYDKTNNVEPDLQNRVSAATLTTVESYVSCVSSNQHGRFNLLPPFLEDSTNFPVAVQDDQLEISDCTGSSDIFPTSGISEDDLDWSGEDCQWINMHPGNAEFKVSLTPRKVPLQGGGLCEFEFDPKLPTGVLSVCAEFEDLGSITLRKCEDDSMIGRNIPCRYCRAA